MATKKEAKPTKKVSKKDETKEKIESKESAPKLRELVEESTISGLVKFTVLILACIFGMIVINLTMLWYLQKSKVEVIAITENGRIINPIPLPQAFVNDSRVLSYVDTCLRNSFSHDFENYRKTVNDATDCYTQSGGIQFKKELEKNLEIIRDKRLVMSVTLEPPSITRGPMLINGRAAWEAQTIMTVFYQGARERYTPQRYAVNVQVVRVPLDESLTGININSIQLKPYVS